MGWFSFTQEIAVDLGTANTIIIHDDKIVIDEPSVVALESKTGKLIAVGEKARQMRMVPMAVGQGEGAEIWRPMGIAVIGGLTFSTLLTLLFVPVMYCIFAFNGVKRQRRKMHKN